MEQARITREGAAPNSPELSADVAVAIATYHEAVAAYKFAEAQELALYDGPPWGRGPCPKPGVTEKDREVVEEEAERRLDAANSAFNAILKVPCRCLADVRTKAEILLTAPASFGGDLEYEEARMLLRSIVGSASPSPIVQLFQKWRDADSAAGASHDQAVIDAHMEVCREAEKEMAQLPSRTAVDFAAKVMVATCYGDFQLGGDNIGLGQSVLDEAKRLVGERGDEQ